MILGFVFSFSTLIADSIQSFLDFMTDIISLVVNKIGKKRANKTYPFGYGQVYYLSNIFTGVLLLLIGIFLMYQVITLNHKFIPNILILLWLFFVLIIKGVVIFALKKYSSSTKSELLLESYKESTTDFISTCVVLLVLLLSFFEDSIPDFINLDKMGSIGMAIYVFYTAFKMIISNISGILTNDEGNEELKGTIKKELESLKWVRLENIKVIKCLIIIVFFYRLM